MDKRELKLNKQIFEVLFIIQNIMSLITTFLLIQRPMDYLHPFQVCSKITKEQSNYK